MEDFDNANEPNLLWNIFENNVRSVLDSICPTKLFNISKNRDPWILDDLINEIKHKDYLLKKAKKSKKSEDWIEARVARNRCLRHVRQAKSDFIKTELENNKNDGRKFWQNLRQVLPNKTKNFTCFDLNNENNQPIPEMEIPNYINSFFSSIGPKLAQNFNDKWFYHGDEVNTVMPNFETDLDEMIGY